MPPNFTPTPDDMNPADPDPPSLTRSPSVRRPSGGGGRWGLVVGHTRRAVVLAGLSGGWLMTFLAFGVEAEATRNPALDALGLGRSLLASAGVSVGLGVCAVALNDVLDRRQDRALGRGGAEEDRPVAAGRVSPQAATAAAVAGLLVAVLAAGTLGPTSFRLAVLVGAGVLFYNLMGRFVPAIGVVTQALLFALAMAIPNPHASFAWPSLLAMTHVVAVGVMRHRWEDRRPRLGAAGAGARRGGRRSAGRRGAGVAPGGNS
ncbi:MAG: UbiA family prenyltransferase, partial [Planctomycetota bacterium]